MGWLNSIVNWNTYGLVDDFTGEDAAAEAAQQAATLQSDAALAAEQGINDRFNTSVDLMRPAIDAGNLARNQQMALLGLNGADQQQAAYDSLSESPGQKFLRERAQKNLLQNAAAIGGLGGGNVRSALVQQGVGFAQTDIENQLARLQGVINPGDTAVTNTVNAGGQAAVQAGNAGMNAAQAQAGGILGAAQAHAQGNQQAWQLGGLALGAYTGGASLPFTNAAGGGNNSWMMNGNASYPNLSLF